MLYLFICYFRNLSVLIFAIIKKFKGESEIFIQFSTLKIFYTTKYFGQGIYHSLRIFILKFVTFQSDLNGKNKSDVHNKFK